MEERYVNVSNDSNLIIEIIKIEQINISYILGKLSNLDLANMDIFVLFDNKKYFKIEFYEKVEEFELEQINVLINEAFDMKKVLKLKKPEINKKDIKIDFEYSKNLAKMTISSKNQKGLVAYVIRTFDEHNINIATAKIHTIKNRARDMFLIEKSEEFLRLKDEILSKLT
jgi:[protein-PII] uridylyltransferase